MVLALLGCGDGPEATRDAGLDRPDSGPGDATDARDSESDGPGGPTGSSAVWTPAGSMGAGRFEHTATLLANGKVLVVGGRSARSVDAALTSAELYDPITGVWMDVEPLLKARRRHTATLLADGRVLVAGGCNSTADRTAEAEIYDPATGTWSTTGSMSGGRQGHAATLLADDKVLVTGGCCTPGATTLAKLLLASAEIYDPAKGTWTITGAMTRPRTDSAALRLPDGTVLVAAGYGATPGPDALYFQPAPEVYDPVTGSWVAGGPLLLDWPFASATLLPSGKVLIAGGQGLNGSDAAHAAQLYDPAARVATDAGAMVAARARPGATLLGNGDVLVAGGSESATILSSAELYSPSSATWSSTRPMLQAREGFSATLLGNGKVLVAGGQSGELGLESAELYSPGQ